MMLGLFSASKNFVIYSTLYLKSVTISRILWLPAIITQWHKDKISNFEKIKEIDNNFSDLVKIYAFENKRFSFFCRRAIQLCNMQSKIV